MKKQTKPKEPAFVAATLRWCNARRKERGKKPLKRLPKGKRNDASSCPCGNATGLLVWSDSFSESDTSNDTPIPVSVKRFVENFDNGRLPQYDLFPSTCSHDPIP